MRNLIATLFVLFVFVAAATAEAQVKQMTVHVIRTAAWQEKVPLGQKDVDPPDSVPVANTTVIVVGSDGIVLLETKTDDKGDFVFPKPMQGFNIYIVTVGRHLAVSQSQYHPETVRTVARLPK